MHQVMCPEAIARWLTLLLEVLDGQLPNPTKPVLANSNSSQDVLVAWLLQSLFTSQYVIPRCTPEVIKNVSLKKVKS
jgi:hypothetical protein